MARISSVAVALAGSLCARDAIAQTHTTTHFDITHVINTPAVPIFGTNLVRGDYFCHVWSQDPIGSGWSWDVAPPWTWAPMPPNYQGQPATWNPYGCERLGVSSIPYGPYSRPYNVCMPGYSAYSPACVSSTSSVTPGQIIIPQSGTGPGWQVQIGIPTLPYSTGCVSAFDFQPMSPGSGLISGTIRSGGDYGDDPYGTFPSRSYAFAWTQVTLERAMRPAVGPPSIPISWDLALANIGIVPTYAYPNPGQTCFYDPISFTATDTNTGAMRTGELFELVVTLANSGGSCTGGHGALVLDTSRGGLRVRMDHPFITPRGGLDIEIENGVVVLSRATGYFASMAMPPVGTSGPLNIVFPSQTFDFVFDATSVFPGDHDVELSMGGAGAERIPEPEPTGAACIAGVCSSGKTESETLAAGGTWQGAGTACASFPYYVEEPFGGFEDISSFGLPSVAGNCDDCGETVPLGFTFNYLGVPFSTVGIASNGYLAFNGPLDIYINQPIPSTGGPTNLLAGYWDDLNPFAGGDVRYATLGVAPNRRFVAQWIDVPHYDATNALYPLHTFQIVLHEGTNDIECRYLDAPVVGGDISPTIGIENAAGTRGVSLDAGELTPKGSRRFVSAPGTGCAPPTSVAYCTAGTTTNACTAMMSASGVPSASAASGFVVSCNGIEGQKQTILFYGASGPAALPWGSGSTSYLCINPPTQRMVALGSGGAINQCDGAVGIDLLAYFASHPGALGTPFSAGQQCWLQSWFRDPPAPKTTSLSNGLQVTFAP